MDLTFSKNGLLVVATVSMLTGGLACRSHAPAPGPAARPRATEFYRAPAPPPRVEPAPPRQPAALPPRYAGPTWFPAGSRLSPRWTTIVIHHSATNNGNAQLFDKFHRGKGWDELGYHFVIGNGSGSADGAIEVGPRWHKQKHGAHCKTPDNYYNEHGIGICLVGDFTRSRPTPRQMAALHQLTRFLATYCHIPPQRVTTHGHINSTTKCPGHHFSLASVRHALSSPATASVMP